MRYSTAVLAALMAVLQVSASPVNVVRRGESSAPSKPTPTLPGPESSFAPFPSASGGFPSVPAFPSESFSVPFKLGGPSESFYLPSGFPSVSLPPFPSGGAFPGPGPSGGRGIPVPSGVSIAFPSEGTSFPFPSGVSIPAFPGPAYTYTASGSGASVPTDCAPGAFSYPYSYPTGGPSVPNPSIARPSVTGKGGVPDAPLAPSALSSVSSLF